MISMYSLKQIIRMAAGITETKGDTRVQVGPGWSVSLRVAVRQAVVKECNRVTRWLMRRLPKRTGRLRRQTTFTVRSGVRGIRLWSNAPYSRYVITAPRIWRQAVDQLQSRFNGLVVQARIRVRVTENNRTRNESFMFKFPLKLAKPQVRTHKVHRLPNELRGTIQPIATAARRELVKQLRTAYL